MNEIIASLIVTIIYLIIVLVLKPNFLMKKTEGEKDMKELDIAKVTVYTVVVASVSFLSFLAFNALNKPKSSFTYYSMDGMREF